MQEHPMEGAVRAILDGYSTLPTYESFMFNSNAPTPDVPVTICKDCAALFKNLKYTSHGVGCERDMAELETAAKNGCGPCAMFLGNTALLTKTWRDHFKGKPRFFLTMVPEYRIPHFLQPEAITPLKFVVYPEKDIHPLLHGIQTQTNTGSEASFALARQWLHRCWTNHVSCRASQNAALGHRPTRLLHLKEPANTIRLCERDEIPQGVVYVTLSHCWGQLAPYKLETSNLATLKRGMALDSLGKTFREAIDISRRLGVSYIWIDCLCIVQDSHEDWESESVQMQYVYGNSFCNIAATDSVDSRGGCFRDRDPRVVQPVRIDMGNDAAKNLGSRFLYLTDAALWWENFEKAPLNERTWVFQERLLAPRVLHFDRDQLVWECNEQTACERFPDGMGGNGDDGDNGDNSLLIEKPKMRLPLERVFQRALAAGITGSEIHDIWRPIVRSYSSTKLTKDTDRLVAIYGVAKRIQAVFGSGYTAGLFSRNMVSQLLWRVGDPQTSCRPAQHVAPSWSWASIVGAIHFMPQWDPFDVDDLANQKKVKPERLDETPYCDVLDTSPINASSSSSSPMVSHDVLWLQCHLTPFFYVSSAETETWEKGKYKMAVQTAASDSDDDDNDTATHKYFKAVSPEPGDPDTWPLQFQSRKWHTVLNRNGSIRKDGCWMHKAYDGKTDSLILVSFNQGDQRTAFHAKLLYDVSSDACRVRQRWLAPVYSTTVWENAALFDPYPLRALNGLILEECGAPREPLFRRVGVFEIRDDPEIQGNNFNIFWDGCYFFKGPETWKSQMSIVRKMDEKIGVEWEMKLKKYEIVIM